MCVCNARTGAIRVMSSCLVCILLTRVPCTCLRTARFSCRFDPLGLGADDGRRAWYVEAELTHGRWAMAGVAGILFTEIVGIEGKWYEQGAKDYGIAPLALLAIQFTVLGWLEMYRLNKYQNNETLFDPAGFSETSQADAMKLREIKNGRLAMIAFVGFATQALVCGEGPLACANQHVLDPFGNNILTNIPKVGNTTLNGIAEMTSIDVSMPPIDTVDMPVDM